MICDGIFGPDYQDGHAENERDDGGRDHDTVLIYPGYATNVKQLDERQVKHLEPRDEPEEVVRQDNLENLRQRNQDLYRTDEELAGDEQRLLAANAMSEALDFGLLAH